MTKKNYQHWQLDYDQGNLLWLTLNCKDKPVNTLNTLTIKELDSIINEVSSNKSCVGVVLQSGKDRGFIAGADIEEFLHFNNEDEAFGLIRHAQTIFDRLEAMKCPTVAMIDGFCLGGGTELALACRYRIAEDSKKTKIGLPEVKLGIHPGFGGTVRLPRLIGAPKALDMILKGRVISAQAAKRIGLVDAAVPERQLRRAARYFILNKPKPHCPTEIEALTNSKPIRSIIARFVDLKLVNKIQREHYPAPFAVLEHWKKYGVYGDKPMIQEAKSAAHCLSTETSKNLIRAFFLQEQMKRLAKDVVFKPKHAHVIGAGVMGGDIAAWCVLHGMRVTLQDREPKFIAPAIKRASKLFQKKLKKPWLVTAALDRLIPDIEGGGVSKADIVIEAVFEDLKTKRALYKDLEKHMKPDAILATNTSSLPLDELNSALKKPERLVGIHFFNPVAKMMLVEVVRGEKTSPEVYKQAIAFVKAIDRLPLPVKSKPGFLVNRILMPYLMESVVLLEEGVPASLIDKAAIDFGMPMGPIELADTVGLDICLSVAKILTKHLGGEMPQRLQQMVDQGKLGRKSGSGFYAYRRGKAIKPQGHFQRKNIEEIRDRLILRMLNEALACLREQVVESEDLLDAGMIFGTGFAPFRGGPIHYMKAQGPILLRDRLSEFAEKYGERFEPDQAWSIFQPKLTRQ